ncbi:uracil-5--methyltransferase TRM9 [Xylaria bambusicola]|uniref:uracil-5--methyltransferase TRM9 n=1 Tax=Xylaria bambusicola TaxID=326684 RepID=UPI002008C4DC|nr:uracil-5--methyltransferase TRM9 [Xylaria bambusicola]KAI0513180.1 uracil-5--methyltransferase TRM9 [Xylaria bambusicola]
MSYPTGSHDTDRTEVKEAEQPSSPSLSANANANASVETSSSSSSTKPQASIRDAAALSPETYEDEHVHSVYESIASHFSSTRYKPWPFIASFLRERVTSGSIGLDVGCGNGKYLGVREGGDVHIVGSDRSPSLVGIARERGFDVAVADGLALPFRAGCADFVLCIAVIHHMSTRERRIDALRKLLTCVRADGGQVLVYVWALEQSSSRRGWDADSAQDQLVPWVMKANQNKKKDKDDRDSGGNAGVDTTYERFYHLYREGELEEDLREAGGRVIESGYERDNWWVIGGHGEEAKP